MVKKGGNPLPKPIAKTLKKTHKLKPAKPFKPKKVKPETSVSPEEAAVKKNQNEQYLKFYTFYRKRLTEEHPKWTNSQITKVIGLLWKKRVLTLTSLDKKDTKEKVRVAVTDSGHKVALPKKPKSAFLLFVQNERPKYPLESNKIDIIKQISIKWKELTLSQKKVYQELAETDKKRYLVEQQSIVKELSFAPLADWQQKQTKKTKKQKSPIGNPLLRVMHQVEGEQNPLKNVLNSMITSS